MRTVAQHLQVKALELRRQGGEFDVFARSAYNRYYYATFLVARECISGLDKNWSHLPHADYPKVIDGKIIKKITEARRKAVNLGDKDLIQTCQQAVYAARSLSLLMKSSSSVRVVADYHPDVPVSFDGSDRFTLAGVDITDAHQWPNRAKAYGTSIADAWRQIDD